METTSHKRNGEKVKRSGIRTELHQTGVRVTGHKWKGFRAGVAL